MIDSKIKYIENKKAKFNYYIEETYIAGISLTGQEVKSIRQALVNLSESYCMFNDSYELFLKNCYIYKYDKIIYTREENADRKLLLTKKELKKLKKKVSIPGYAIIPLSITVPTYGYIKIKIGLCKGKHNYDKRETIKKRDIEREMKIGS